MKISKTFFSLILVSIFSVSLAYAQTQELSPLQKISLKFYCFTAPLFGDDTSRCGEKLAVASFATTQNTSLISNSKTNKVLQKNESQGTSQIVNNTSETKVVTERIVEQPLYITRYISTPAPKGEKGDQAELEVTKTTQASNSNTYNSTFSSNTYAGAAYAGYFAPPANTSSQLVGASTVGYLNGATSENTLLKTTTTVEGILNLSAVTTFYSSPLFTQGFTSSATSTFNDPSFFNALATFASLPSMPLTFGNVLVGSSTGKAEPLAPGTQNQIFTINASGTPEWMSGATLTGLSVVGTTTLQGPVNINTTGTSTTTIGNASSSIVLAAGTLTSIASSFATSTIGSLILGTTTTATTTNEVLMRDLTTGEVKSLSASNFLLAATTNSATTSSNTLTSTVNGITATTTLITSNVLTSLSNTLTSTVNGITSTAVNLINSFTQTLTGNTLTTTINGVMATSSVISSNTLAVATTTNDVIISSDINGVLATTTFSAVNSNVATSTGNFLSTIVNGASSGLASIINSFTQTLSGNTLTTTINGVTATSSIVSSNGLDVTGTDLTSTVNGIATTINLKDLVASSTDNALSFTGNVLTSTVNGKVATSTIIDTSVATSSANLLTTIINGITSTAANIINSFTQSLSGNTLTTTINGVTATSSVISSNTLSAASGANAITLTSNVNGVATTSSFNIINLNEAFTSGTTLTTRINGIATSTDLTNLVASSTSNTLTVSTSINSLILTSIVNGKVATTTTNFINANALASALNTLTSTVNGVTSTSSIINTNVATSTGNLLTTVINGVTSTAANIINSFTQSFSGNTLTTTINGVMATSSVISNNLLSYATSTGLLTSDVNGVISTTTISANLAGLSSGELIFGNSTGGVSQSSNLFWDNVNARLGIGTNAPTQKFQVVGTTLIGTNVVSDIWTTLYLNGPQGSNWLRMFNSLTGSTNDDGFQIGNTGTNAFINNKENGSLIFGTFDTERIRISATGNLGVGTSTPSSRLSVIGNSSADPALYVYNTSNINGSPSAIFRGGAGNAGFANFEVQNQDGRSALAIEGTGALWLGGINTGASLSYNSGDSTLRSNRSLAINSSQNPVLSLNGFTVQNTGLALQFDGDITATSYTNSSDTRLKKEVSTTTSALDKLRFLRPVDFKWISASSSQTLQHGFIAQEVETVMPELVVTKQDGYKAVNYMSLISVLTGGVQDLDGKIETGFVSVSPESLASWTQAGAITALTDSAKNEAPRNALAYITEKMTAGYKAISDFSALRITAIQGYFENIFAKQVHTEKVCLGTPGNETCITKGDLDKMLSEKTMSVSNSGGTVGDTSSSPTSSSSTATSSGNTATTTNEAVSTSTEVLPSIDTTTSSSENSGSSL